jgi:hypothetical protein
MTYTHNPRPTFIVFLRIIFTALVLSDYPVFSQDQKQVATDSIPGPDLVITPRFNSAGHFPFTGALLNRNINFDLNVFFEHRGYGFFIFKSWDLEDKRSFVNYLQPGIFRKFQLAPEFAVRVFFGYVFSQTSGFRDKDSDYFTAAVGYWTINDKLKLENCALFYDLSQSAKLANRLLVSRDIKKFRIDFYVWHRIVFEQGIHATSASLALNFPRIKLSDALFIQTTFSYQGYITKTKPDFAMRDGFLFQVAFPLLVKI